MVFLFHCLPDRLLRKTAYISVSVFTLLAASSGVSQRQTFYFCFLACVWMRIFFLTSAILSMLCPSFPHSSHWCHFPAVSVSLLCCPLLHLCLSNLFSTSFVLPAAEFKEGTLVHMAVLQRKCCLQQAGVSLTREAQKVYQTQDKILKLLSTAFRKNTSE